MLTADQLIQDIQCDSKYFTQIFTGSIPNEFLGTPTICGETVRCQSINMFRTLT